MNIWHDIDEERIYPTDFMAVVEISMGSNMKYELDKKTGMLSLDRVLFTATHYPMNYGFIPRTYADDHDPLDALLLCSDGLSNLVDAGEMESLLLASSDDDAVCRELLRMALDRGAPDNVTLALVRR